MYHHDRTLPSEIMLDDGRHEYRMGPRATCDGPESHLRCKVAAAPGHTAGGEMTLAECRSASRLEFDGLRGSDIIPPPLPDSCAPRFRTSSPCTCARVLLLRHSVAIDGSLPLGSSASDSLSEVAFEMECDTSCEGAPFPCLCQSLNSLSAPFTAGGVAKVHPSLASVRHARMLPLLLTRWASGRHAFRGTNVERLAGA